MSRSQVSGINFNINIKGAQDIRALTKELPKVIKQFEQLSDAIQKVENAGGGGKGGGSSVSKGGVSDRMSRIELGVKKGDIQSVQQLHGHYGQLVAQMNRLERAGKKTGSLRLRAFKQHQKLTQKVRQETAAKRDLIRANYNAAGSTDRMRQGLLSNIGSIKLSTQTLKQASQQVTQAAGATKNASYLLLNTGYLIQDSPYGIRGMANNISQLAQSYQMLSQRIQYLNASQGTNLTVWGQLTSLMKGPTGIILLIGSVLPAALELVNMHWDKLTGSQKDNKLESEDHLEVLREYISWSDELRKNLGEDPLGVLSSESEVNHLEEIEGSLTEIEESEEKILELRLQQARQSGLLGQILHKLAGTYAFDVEKKVQDIEEGTGDLVEKLGKLSGIDLEPLRDEIEKTNARIEFQNFLLNRDPAALLEQQYSRIIEALQQKLELAENAGRDQMAENAKSAINSYVSFFKSNLQGAIDSGDMDLAVVFNRLLEDARMDAEDEADSGGDTEGTFNAFKLFTGFDSPEDAAEYMNQLMSDALSITEFGAEVRMEDATNTNQRLEALSEAHSARMQEIERKKKAGEYENQYQYNQAILEETRNYTQEREEIRQRALQHELQMDAQYIREGIDSANTFDDKLQGVRDYYDKRRQIAFETITDEIELVERLAEIRRNQNKEEEAIEEQKFNRKQEIVSNYANFAIQSGQALLQATDASARKQFQIQKVASASKAVVNGYLAFTKTLAEGGALATPLAYSTLALSLAQAGKIMSQSYDSARSTGAQGGASYRGFDFGESQSAIGYSGGTPFQGSRNVSNNRSNNLNQPFPNSVAMNVNDGFGNIVAKGTLDLQSQGKDDLGYLKSTNNG